MEGWAGGFFFLLFIVGMLVGASLIAVLAGAIVAVMRINRRAAAHLPAVETVIAVTFVSVMLVACVAMLYVGG